MEYTSWPKVVTALSQVHLAFSARTVLQGRIQQAWEAQPHKVWENAWLLAMGVESNSKLRSHQGLQEGYAE